MFRKRAWYAGAMLLGACVALGAGETVSVKRKAASSQRALPYSEKTDDGCTIERFTVHSPKMDREIRTSVVLPPGYESNPQQRFPVLYTLHGMFASYDSYAEMPTLRRTLKDHPMIIVGFDGDKTGWYLDSTKDPKSQFETFFYDELIPYIDGHFRTKARPEYRGVTGFSMGGHGAFYYMLARPGVVGSVSTMSAVFSFDDNQSPRRMKTLIPLLGPYEENKEEYAKFRLLPLLAEHFKKDLPTPPIYIHCGTEDHLIEENRAMAVYLMQVNKERKAAGKPAVIFQYKESPGAHTWPFWRDGAVGVADFHWRCFEQAAHVAATKPAEK
jgi:S-formylglutathione hydrolase FrmB